MHIEELVSAYADSHDLERGTLVWFNCAASRWARHLGRLPDVADFTDAAFNAWLTAELKGARLSRQTVSSYRRAVLMLWRWGWREGHIAVCPRNLKPVKAPLPIPVGLAACDVDRLLSAAAKVPGRFRKTGVLKSAFFRALILLCWDSGLRLGDCLRITWVDIERGVIPQKKTGYPKSFRLSPPTRSALRDVRLKGEPRVLGGVVTRRYVVTGMKKIREAAGLPIGGTKAIRKGGASLVEREMKGAAQHYLGHRTPGLAARHYLDPSIVNDEPPTPPPLTG